MAAQDYPDDFKKVVPFLLASVVFHNDSGFLPMALRRDHPFWSSLFVRDGFLEKLTGQAAGGVMLCKECGLQATGVPQHTVLQATISQQSERLKVSSSCPSPKIREDPL